MEPGAQSARQIAREASEGLEKAGVPEPVASAEILLTELLGIRRSELALNGVQITEEQANRYESWISRRKEREPVQRILGYTHFRNLRLDLNEHTLIPRPDTESVVEAALEAIGRCGGPCRVLDLGTGSGAIAISTAQDRPSCEVHATDNSRGALEMASRNADRAGTPVRFHEVDLFAGLDSLTGSISVLISNPPYVKSADISKLESEVRDWEPHAALDGGSDGLDFYRHIFTGAKPLLLTGAEIVLEVGDGQADAVIELGRSAGYTPVETYPDLNGALRTVLLRWGSS